MDHLSHAIALAPRFWPALVERARLWAAVGDWEQVLGTMGVPRSITIKYRSVIKTRSAEDVTYCSHINKYIRECSDVFSFVPTFFFVCLKLVCNNKTATVAVTVYWFVT